MRVGIDIIEHDRFARAIRRHPRLLERVFTPAEISYCESRPNPLQHFAARFAAKEAVGKAIGSGVLCWQDIEILSRGKPRVSVTGRTGQAAARNGAGDLELSISHSGSLSVSVAVAADNPLPERGS
jgi:holo-[acyl-carrier protein] synthase